MVFAVQVKEEICRSLAFWTLAASISKHVRSFGHVHGETLPESCAPRTSILRSSGAHGMVRRFFVRLAGFETTGAPENSLTGIKKFKPSQSIPTDFYQDFLYPGWVGVFMFPKKKPVGWSMIPRRRRTPKGGGQKLTKSQWKTVIQC